MASYRQRIKFKNDLILANMRNTFWFRYMAYYTKHKLKYRPLFDTVVVKMTKEMLDRGQEEVRFYFGDNNTQYESLKEVYEYYCREYNWDGFYSYKLFLHVATQIEARLDRFITRSDSDLIVEVKTIDHDECIIVRYK